jgi:cell shape-determining protein MreC
MSKPKREGWLLIVLIVIFIVLIFLEPSYGWKVRIWLTPQAALQADDPSLAAQNETLEAQLAVLQSIQSQIPNSSPDYIRAMIYSRYPFNFKDEILVSAGTNEGVAVGKVVVFQGIFIGTIEKTFDDSSLVQTVFDSNLKMPVRVGVTGYDALLVGGTYPVLTSIQKSAPLTPGDIVYTAESELPYGLPVAIVASTSTSPDDLFLGASLGFAYDLNTMQTVLIAK